MKNYLIIIVLLAAVLLACNKEEEIIPEKSIPVTVQNVEVLNVSIPVITSGKISASTETTLSFKTGGIVKRIFVNEGETVKKGRILAELDLSEISAKVLQAKAGFEKAERDLERIRSLYKDSVVTLEQLQNVETAYDVSSANLDVAKFNLDHSKIIAPTNGRIYRRFVEANELVAPGTPIIIFGSAGDSWTIKVGITDKYISKFKIGDSAKIYLDAFPSESFKAKISEIAGSSNPYSGTYEIELSLSETNKNIVSGMIANVEIFSSEEVKSVLVPIEALVNANGNLAELYTVTKDREKVKKISVELGAMIEDKVIINKSSNEFNEVIVDGVEYINENSKIKIRETGERK